MAATAPRPRPVVDPVIAVRYRGGDATTGELLPLTTRWRLEDAVRAGRLSRPVRGRYVLPTLPAPERATAAARGVLSHLSAAVAWEIPVVAVPALVHVTVPHGAKPVRQPGVQVHRSTTLTCEDVADGITTPIRTVLDCAAVLPFAEALAVADGALGMSYVRPDELRAAARATKGPGRARRIAVADAADRRADNPFESSLRAVVLSRGIEGFIPQHPVRLRTGRVVHVDLGAPGRRLALEADSYEHHGTRSALVRDCERYDELVVAGWRVLRFAYEQVMFRPDWVGGVLAAAVEEPSKRRRPAVVRRNPSMIASSGF